MLKDVKEKLKNLPATSGVYYFYGENGNLLYIGKAASLKSRVSSYFLKTVYDNKTQALADRIYDLKFQETESVLEALILEANEIKKYQPPYNVRAKDDKTFVNIVITKEEFPRILVIRPTEDLGLEFKKVYGPYTSAKSAREAVRIIKKIIPFHSRNEKSEKKCLDFHIGLCPGPYAGAISHEDYMKNIRRIQMILEGKKKGLIRDLEKEMKKFSGLHKFEEAAIARDKIFALEHIMDVALLSSMSDKISNFQFPISNQFSILNGKNKRKLNKISEELIYRRIEAYDISNISGMFAVGSMVVFENGEIAKDEYRKFKIRTVAQANDVGMLKEVLSRRFRHTEWKMPDLILLDGGRAQVNGAQEILDQYKLNIPAIGAAKGPTRKGLDLYFSDKWKNQEETGISELGVSLDSENVKVKKKTGADFSQEKELIIDKKLIAHIMSEAHRFAITYHRLLRKKGSLSK